MSKQKPINIILSSKMEVNPNYIFQSKVVKSGNGAVINAFKRFIGMVATVIISEDKMEDKELTKKERKKLGEKWIENEN